jgi:hypothetical protein
LFGIAKYSSLKDTRSDSFLDDAECSQHAIFLTSTMSAKDRLPTMLIGSRWKIATLSVCGRRQVATTKLR